MWPLSPSFRPADSVEPTSMNTTEHGSQPAFDNARMLGEGSFTTPQGNVVHTYYVDLAGKQLPERLCLVKVSEPQFDLRTADSIRLSRPSVFRETGEVLIKDEQEGRARTSATEAIEGPTRETAQMDRRVRAINAGLRLCHANLSVSGSATTKRTNTVSEAWTFGKDWLVYCTSLPPDVAEEDTWRRTFPENYTSVARIHRPTQFAQALGLAVCEHIGATGKPAPMKGVFHGFKTFEVHRTPQIVLHGPVLYVDDPYRCIDAADTGWAKICSMIFVKSREYAAQKEYRFAMLSIPPEAGEVVDLPVSGMLKDCLLPVKAPLGLANAPVTIARDEREPGEQHETSGYTYRRRRVRRESGNWSDGEPGSGRAKEEIVEETVASPEEVPEPFPEEPKQPDIIVFERVGKQIRFGHAIHREEETTRWRIETLATNRVMVDDPGPGSLPRALDVPQEDQFEALHQPPTDPRFVLELCLNPSVPRPPRPYEGLPRCSPAEVEHALGCWRSLGAAVDMLDGEDREHAAASAWYAAEFIVDLVSWFGPIVKSVRIIRECVAVVEFERAPFSGAVGWATFSGTGTYTLYVHRENVEEVIFSGRSRAGRMSPNNYMEALQKHGWHLKTPSPSL